MLAASFAAPVAAQDDALPSEDQTGRATVSSPIDSTKAAAERWQRLKANVATNPATPATLSRAPRSEAPPLPDDDWTTSALEAERVAPALPDAAFEPAWLVPSRELTPEEADLSSDAAQWRSASEWRPHAPRVEAADLIEFVPGQQSRVTTVAQTSPATIWPLLAASDPRRTVRGIHEISPYYDLTVDQDIRDYADKQATVYGVKFGDEVYTPRAFPDAVFPWEASNLYHYPLYFEDPALERYGHTHGFVCQPFVSAARFSGQLLALPYQMAIDPMCCEMYALGWYRPGDCAPKLKYKIPWNTHAAVVEAGVVTGLFFLIP